MMMHKLNSQAEQRRHVSTVNTACTGDDNEFCSHVAQFTQKTITPNYCRTEHHKAGDTDFPVQRVVGGFVDLCNSCWHVISIRWSPTDMALNRFKYIAVKFDQLPLCAAAHSNAGMHAPDLFVCSATAAAAAPATTA